MTAELNHTIVNARDRWAAARSLAETLGLPEPTADGPFAAVAMTNGVTLDFMDSREVPVQHYAFLIDEETFDAVAARLAERGIPTFADPPPPHTGPERPFRRARALLGLLGRTQPRSADPNLRGHTKVRIVVWRKRKVTITIDADLFESWTPAATCRPS